MSKFICNCEYVIDLTNSPANEEFLLIPELNVEKATTLCSEGEADEDQFYEALDNGSRQVIICPNCGRLWLSEDGSDYRSYLKEEE